MKTKGRIIKIGEVRVSQRGTRMLDVSIQIGWHEYKSYNRQTQQLEDRKVADVLLWTVFHENVAAVQQGYKVGDVVELEYSHYVDEQWLRTIVAIDYVKVVESAQPVQQAPVAQPAVSAPVADATTHGEESQGTLPF